MTDPNADLYAILDMGRDPAHIHLLKGALIAAGAAAAGYLSAVVFRDRPHRNHTRDQPKDPTP